MQNQHTEHVQHSGLEQPTGNQSKAPLKRPAERSFLNETFFGGTKSSTYRGWTIAFKRGLLVATIIGLIVAGIIAGILIAKGFTVLSLFVPVVGTIVGCVILAGISMLCYGLYKRYTNLSNTTNSRRAYQPIGFNPDVYNFDADFSPSSSTNPAPAHDLEPGNSRSTQVNFFGTGFRESALPQNAPNPASGLQPGGSRYGANQPPVRIELLSDDEHPQDEYTTSKPGQ